MDNLGGAQRLAAAHASRVDECFATQLQDVSDLLDWWLAQVGSGNVTDDVGALGGGGDDGEAQEAKLDHS